MPKRPTFLCVDDQAPNLRIRTMLLEQFGCETIAAEDHHTVLRLVAERAIDLIVIDHHLAYGETGEDIARDVRVMRPEIPLIMLTGDNSLPASACAAVDAVLIKGASNPTALFDLIGELVPGSALRPRPRMPVAEPRKKIEKQRKAS